MLGIEQRSRRDKESDHACRPCNFDCSPCRCEPDWVGLGIRGAVGPAPEQAAPWLDGSLFGHHDSHERERIFVSFRSRDARANYWNPVALRIGPSSVRPLLPATRRAVADDLRHFCGDSTILELLCADRAALRESARI